MKTIMFNDEPYGLTAAVLNGTKTHTRRIVPDSHIAKYEEFKAANPHSKLSLGDFLVRRGLARYAVGEIVAIAQSYESLGLSPSIVQRAKGHDKKNISYVPIGEQAGWRNKMYVAADYMPYRIRITLARFERLQSISDDDIMADGIRVIKDGRLYSTNLGMESAQIKARSLRGAYAKLIDGVSKKRIYHTNPYVYVFGFELAE